MTEMPEKRPKHFMEGSGKRMMAKRQQLREVREKQRKGEGGGGRK
jgi:hypothetical protein